MAPPTASLRSPAGGGFPREGAGADSADSPFLSFRSVREALPHALIEKFAEFVRSRESAQSSARSSAALLQTVKQAPAPKLPSRLPPVGEVAMQQLLTRRGHPTAQACWTAARESSLHLSAALADPMEELFHPPGFAERTPEAVLDWVESMETASAIELNESFAEVRQLSGRLQAASLRAREAVTMAAWLHAARSKAEATDLKLMR